MNLLRGKEGFGGFEADRLRDRILCTQRFRRSEVGLSTQRMSRGRDLDFIYARNPARPGSDVDLHKGFVEPWFNKKLVSRMGTRVNTTSAQRALVLQTLLRTTNGYLTDRQSSMIDGAQCISGTRLMKIVIQTKNE